MSKNSLLVVVGIVIIVVSVVAFSHVGESKFQLSDRLVAKEDIVVVMDYNTQFQSKPDCTIVKGSTVTITGFSTLLPGTGAAQPLIELSSSSCTGYANDNSSLNKKLK